MTTTRKVLGRGLGALIPPIPGPAQPVAPTPPAPNVSVPGGKVAHVDVSPAPGVAMTPGSPTTAPRTLVPPPPATTTSPAAPTSPQAPQAAAGTMPSGSASASTGGAQPLPAGNVLAARATAVAVNPGKQVRTFLVGIEEIAPQPGQPRRAFDEATLAELAASIRENGILQPLLVRTRAKTGETGATSASYELIAGERRWRAAQRAGLTEVPVVVKEATSKETFEWALVENLQRQDLNPMEEAEAYDRLVHEYGMTQEQVAGRVGKDRSSVTNALRLLRLPPSVRRMVEDGSVSMGQARALLGLEHAAQMERMAALAVGRGLSVRQVEALVTTERKRVSGKSTDKPPSKSATLRDLETKLASSLGARVKIVDDDGKGHIAISWSSLDELDRILDKLLGRAPVRPPIIMPAGTTEKIA